MAVGKVVEGRWTRCLEEMERDGMQWEEMEQGKIMRGPDSESPLSLLIFYFVLYIPKQYGNPDLFDFLDQTLIGEITSVDTVYN